MSRFVYRGPLAPDSPLFRGRQAELTRLEQLCQGEVQSYAIIYAGRQMGKTSLLLRLAVRLSPLARTAHIDFQNIPRARLAETLGYIAQCVSESVPELTESAPISTGSGLRQFLIRAIGCLPERRLILSMEEIGALEREVRQDLANVIRSLFTNRFDPARRALGRLVIVIAGSIELYELAATEVSTLHSICESFYLPDLDEVDCVGLISEALVGLGLPQDTADSLGEAVYVQVGGHPYLTQRLGALLEEFDSTGQTLTLETLTSAIENLSSNNDPLLTHVRRALQENHYDTAVRTLLTERVRFSREDEEMARLELLGLAKGNGSYWQVRNHLFERTLNDWLGLQSPTAMPSKSNFTIKGETIDVGNDLTGRDKVVSAGGHIIHAEAGATVIIGDTHPSASQAATALTRASMSQPIVGDLASSVVAICGVDGSVVGTGFIAANHLILTCAHVVEAADGGPGDTINVRFQFNGVEQSVQVVSEFWRSPKAEDIAVLRLDGGLPAGITPLVLGSTAGCEGHLFRSFGYPPIGQVDGIWATGKIEGLVREQGRSLIQLTSQNLAQGISGAPVLDETTRRIVGMVTAVNHPDATTKHRDTAFATPAETLWQVCPELG